MLKHIPVPLALIILILFSAGTAAARQYPVSVENYDLRGIAETGLAYYSVLEKNGVIYGGNESGLMRFNGNVWEIYKPGKDAPITALLLCGNRIYGAGVGNFGYWEEDECGRLKYTSLYSCFDGTLLKGEYILQLASEGDRIYIQSYRGLFILDGKTAKAVKGGEGTRSIFKCGNDLLFFRKGDGSVCRLDSGRAEVCLKSGINDDSEATFIERMDDGRYIIAFKDGKFFSTGTEGSSFMLYNLRDDFPGTTVTGCDAAGLLFTIGTQKDGIIAFNSKILQKGHDERRGIRSVLAECRHLDVPELADGTIKFLKFTDENTLWVSSGSGFSRLEFKPSLYIWKKDSEIGTFTDVAAHNGKIYVCTDAGVFLFSNGDAVRMSGRTDFLSLAEIKGTLFAGAKNGIYTLDDKDNIFKKAFDAPDIGQFELIPSKNGDYLFAQTVFGFYIFRYDFSHWRQLSKFAIDKFGRMAAENPKTVWFIQSDLGIWRYYLSDDMLSVISSDHFVDIGGCSDFDKIHMIKVDDGMLFFTPDGIFMYDAVLKKFNRLESLSSSFHLKSSYAIESAGGNSVWTAGNDGLFKYNIENLTATCTLKKALSGKWLLNNSNHVYHIRTIGDSLTFFRTMSATAILDETLAKKEVFDGVLRIDRIMYKNRRGDVFYMPLGKDKMRLPAGTSYIEIHLATGSDSRSNMISYRIGKNYSATSPWQTDGRIILPNVLPGTYTMVANNAYMKTLRVQFKVPAPLFERPWMYSAYMLLGLGVLYIMYLLYRKYRLVLKRRKEEEEKRKSIDMTERADQIKSKEKVLSLEYYYVEVHHDFIVRLKHKYPELTTSDLKLACYIRAGLSSKEISQLLNIETNSVDVKKTRLKKRLNMDKNKQLSDFLISF